MGHIYKRRKKAFNEKLLQRKANREATGSLGKKAVGVIGALTLALVSCTSDANVQAINAFERSELARESAFEVNKRNLKRALFQTAAKELTLSNSDEEDVKILKAYTEARDKIEETTEAYERANTLARVVVGNYLYTDQGFINILFEDASKDLTKASEGLIHARDESEIDTFLNLVPHDFIPATEIPVQKKSLESILQENLK